METDNKPLIDELTERGRYYSDTTTQMMDDRLARQALFVTIVPGDTFTWYDTQFTVTAVAYPFIVAEYQYTDVDFQCGQCVHFKGAQLTVVRGTGQGTGSQLAFEFTGITRKLERAIDAGDRARATAEKTRSHFGGLRKKRNKKRGRR